MTSTLAHLRTSGSVPVVDGVARVHAVLDEVADAEVGEVRGHDVAEVERAIARMEGLKLRMVAAAHRQDAARRAGMSGTGAWLAAHTRSWGAKAAADVSLATALDGAAPLARAALLDGALTTAHAAIIAGTVQRLPEALSAQERAKVEAALVAHARVVGPGQLRRSARRALAAAGRTAEETLRHEDDELRGEEARAAQRTRLTMHDNQDGTVTGHFTVPSLAGAILRKTIQQMVSPRRRLAGGGDSHDTGRHPQSDGHDTHDSGRHPQPGSHNACDSRRHFQPGGDDTHDTHDSSRHPQPGGPDTQDSPRRGRPVGDEAIPHDWAREYGAAFVELLEHLPTDRLTGKVAATVVVTIDHEHLRTSLGAARLDTGHDVSASQARRLACSAGILPAVLDGSSLPLDLGRTRRFFGEAQRVALATTYDQCAAHGCDRPYAWCELHHEDPWARGGVTDLSLAVPVCAFHHRLAHDPRYEHRVSTDGRGPKVVTFSRCG